MPSPPAPEKRRATAAHDGCSSDWWRSERCASSPAVRPSDCTGSDMARRARPKENLDTELADLPPDLRWREWMGRVEAVIFASPTPVPHEILTALVGKTCPLDDVITDIR